MRCEHSVREGSVGTIDYRVRLRPETPYTFRNIFARLAVEHYMGDVLRKQTRREAEAHSSQNVGSCERTPETQAISAVQVHLTTKEARLLQFLAENPGRIFSRDSLLKMIWGYADGVTSRTVDVHIQRLRKKLRGNRALTIHTIFGRGYVLEHRVTMDVTI